ncbi:MAG: FAD-dependent oxidoreductase [Erythrobacter sp.]
MTTGTAQSVVIIGGGIVGIACAHYLNEAGHSVIILESGTMAGACSYGNCGYICPSHALPLAEPSALREGFASLFDSTAAFRVKPRFDPSFVNWMWQFARRCTRSTMIENGHHLHAMLQSSIEEYARLVAGKINGSEWKQTGLLYAFKTAKGVDSFANTANFLHESYGIRSNRLTGAELTSFDGSLVPDLMGGFHFPDDSSVRPDGLTSGWLAHLRMQGVKIVEGASIERIERSGSKITSIVTSKEQFLADHYVLAAGAVSGQLASMFGSNLPIEPGKGYSITMERPDHAPKVPMLFPEHHVGVSPFENGFRIGSMMEFVGFDKTIPPYRLDQLRHAASQYLVGKLPSANVENWFGWRPMTWDSLPIIGSFQDIENLCCATGHNMLGMSLAPATGKLVAELISGGATHIDPSPYSPNRF